MTFLTLLLRNLLRRKTRSAFTILGVAVAVGTLILLRGLSQGFEESFLLNFERRGVDLVVTAAGVPDQLRSDLDERIGAKIAKMPHIERATGGLLELVEVKRGEGVLSILVHGWEPEGPLFKDLKILAGRGLKLGEQHKVLLGMTLAENLGKTAGDTVEIQDETYEIVGVFQSFAIYENGGAVIPLEELQSLMQRKGSVTGFSVVIDDGPDKVTWIEETRKAIEALTDDNGKSYRITAIPTREYVQNSAPIQIAHGFAWVTSLVALFIGAISMLNTMIMSVLERTREIGILRAIGWRRRRIVQMILGEALLLCLVGALVGALLAATVMFVLARTPQTSGFVSGSIAPIVVLQGLLLTLAVALIGGMYPAWRASRLEPTEALRHD